MQRERRIGRCRFLLELRCPIAGLDREYVRVLRVHDEADAPVLDGEAQLVAFPPDATVRMGLRTQAQRRDDALTQRQRAALRDPFELAQREVGEVDGVALERIARGAATGRRIAEPAAARLGPRVGVGARKA